jgi:hypothetical protein
MFIIPIESKINSSIKTENKENVFGFKDFFLDVIQNV